jgi:hypothetical protein
VARIVYILKGTEIPTGGHKMIVRHVEALSRMGFDAVARMPERESSPRWFEHDAPIQCGGALEEDDILVIPDDAFGILKEFAFSTHRKIVFCQNHFRAASGGLGFLAPDHMRRYREFIACSQTTAGWLGAYFPGSAIDIVPAFADERLFRPLSKAPMIVCTPRKRQIEARAVRFIFSRLYSGRAKWKWANVESAAEATVAGAFGAAAIFLSLNRLEGLGITPLEAMAAECVVAGFTGIGGREYATSANGFWVDEDDCEACAWALINAARLVEVGGPALANTKKSAAKTAADWSYAGFLRALEAYWRRVAAA